MLRLDLASPRAKPRVIARLEARGHIERCLVCDGLSAYAWCDVDESLGVAFIGAASCWEWECGHCRAHHVQADSPILHPAYTHAED